MHWADWLWITLGLLGLLSLAWCLYWPGVASRLSGWRNMLPAFPSLPKWQSWRWPDMLSGSPMMWVVVVLGLALPATFGTMKVLEAKRVQAAYDKGVTAGKDSAS